MSESTKKGVLIGVIVLALAVAGFSAFKYMTTDKIVVEKEITMPPGFKSEKERALEEQGKGGGAGGKGAEEKDLGG